MVFAIILRFSNQIVLKRINIIIVDLVSGSLTSQIKPYYRLHTKWRSDLPLLNVEEKFPAMTKREKKIIIANSDENSPIKTTFRIDQSGLKDHFWSVQKVVSCLRKWMKKILRPGSKVFSSREMNFKRS